MAEHVVSAEQIEDSPSVEVGLVIVAALAGVVGWLGYRGYQAREAQAQRDLFVQVARQTAVNLTTISFTEADTDVQRILDSATGTFRDDFQTRSKPFVDVVKQAQSKSEGTVTEAGLESETGDAAQVLVAVDGEDVDSRCARTRPAQMAAADKRSENGRWREGIERPIRAVSTRTTITAQEEGFAMSVDTDRIIDASPPELQDEPIDVAAEAEAADEAPTQRAARFSWTRLLVYGVLPVFALILALGAGYLKWQDGSARLSQRAAAQAVRAATDSTIAILSYKPETVDKDLTAAADRLTGSFRDQYTQLITTVVAPGAKQQHISAVATVPAAASVSASADHAVVFVLVNQATTVGNDPPTNTASSVRVTLDKVHDRWLISQFEPV